MLRCFLQVAPLAANDGKFISLEWQCKTPALVPILITGSNYFLSPHRQSVPSLRKKHISFLCHCVWKPELLNQVMNSNQSRGNTCVFTSTMNGIVKVVFMEFLGGNERGSNALRRGRAIKRECRRKTKRTHQTSRVCTSWHGKSIMRLQTAKRSPPSD